MGGSDAPPRGLVKQIPARNPEVVDYPTLIVGVVLLEWSPSHTALGHPGHKNDVVFQKDACLTVLFFLLGATSGGSLDGEEPGGLPRQWCFGGQ